MLARAIAAALVAAWLAAPAAGGPAELPIEAVSFDEAVRRAIENNRDVARAATAILAAEALLARARADLKPVVDAVAVETWIDDERGFSTNVVQPDPQFALRATAAVPVLAPALWAARTQAADQVEIARLAAADVERQVAVAAAQAYLAIIAERRQLDVDERARDNARAQFDYAQTRFEGGSGSKLNALRAADTLATDEVLVERSRATLRLAQEALGVLLAADRPIDAAAEPIFETPPAEAEADPVLGERTDLRLLEAQREAADRVLRDSWKDRMPTVEAAFSPAHVDPAGAFEEEDTWRATLGARIPVYLGGALRADRHLRRTELTTAEIDLDQARLRARAEVRAARIAIDAASRGLVNARLAAQHANDVLRITDIAFRAGATTNIELIDAQRRARDSETAVGQAEDLLRQARLDLLVALGRFPG
jgi:outer membrane protein TolC